MTESCSLPQVLTFSSLFLAKVTFNAVLIQCKMPNMSSQPSTVFHLPSHSYMLITYTVTVCHASPNFHKKFPNCPKLLTTQKTTSKEDQKPRKGNVDQKFQNESYVPCPWSSHQNGKAQHSPRLKEPFPATKLFLIKHKNWQT